MSRREAASYRRVSVSTVQYWIDRYRRAGEDARRSGQWAEDRPSTPRRQPGRVSEAVHDRVCAARERTGWGPRLIASELAMAHATVSRCLRRRGVSRMPRPAREQVRRFEWPCPGDLLQMDTKRLARFTRPGHKVTGDRSSTSAERKARVGWEYCHSIIDDHSRLVYTELHRDERAETVTGFVATDPRPRMGPWTALPLKQRPRHRLADLARALQHAPQPSSLGNRPPISRVRKDPRHNG